MAGLVDLVAHEGAGAGGAEGAAGVAADATGAGGEERVGDFAQGVAGTNVVNLCSRALGSMKRRGWRS